MLLPDQLVDDEPRLGAVLAFDDHHQGFPRVGNLALNIQDAMQRNEADVFAADRRDLGSARKGADLVLVGADALNDAAEGKDIFLLAGRDEHPVQHSQSERNHQREARAFSGRRLDLNAAADIGDVAPDDVHADAAPGDFSDLFRRRKTWSEKKTVNFVVAELLVLADDALGDGAPEHLRAVDARAVVGDGDEDIAGALRCRKLDGRFLGFAGGAPHLIVLDAMVDGITDHVRNRVRKLLDDGLVHLGLIAGGDEPHFLAKLR